MNLEVFKGLLKPLLPLIKFLGWQNRIEELESLCSFISRRSSYVAQVSLYGYLKARAGTLPAQVPSPGDLREVPRSVDGKDPSLVLWGARSGEVLVCARADGRVQLTPSRAGRNFTIRFVCSCEATARFDVHIQT